MLVCRVDESQVVENLVQIDKEPFDKETTPEKNTGTTHEETVLRARSPGAIYDTIATTELDQFFKPPPHILPPFVWQRPLGTTPAMRKVVILRGVIGGFGFVNYYYTLSTLPLGDATTLLSLYPIVTIFLARILIGEEIRPLNIIAALLSVTGAVLVSRPSFLFDSDEDEGRERRPMLGYVTAVMGSLCASGVIVLIHKAGLAGAHILQLLFSWVVFGVTFSVLLGGLAGQAYAPARWRVPSRQELPYVLGVCASGTAAHFLLNHAARLVPASTAGLLRSSDILWAYGLGRLALNQRPPGATWAGAALVGAGLALVPWASREERGRIATHSTSVGNPTAVK